MIAAGANVNVGDENGETSLHISAFHNHFKVFQILIAAGANVNAVGKNIGTPLHYVSQSNHFGYDHLKIVQALIAAGADVNAINEKGETPLDISDDNAHETVQCLLHHGAFFLVKKDLLSETSYQATHPRP